MEEEELMWSLFAVDMESALEMQPPDTWDSFPLFQLLNDYLRLDGKLRDAASNPSLYASDRSGGPVCVFV